MDPNDTKSLANKGGPQWDVSQTAFQSAGALRGLIRAVSQDDIQAQAVLAAEALGIGLLVSPALIDKAVVALGGEDSVKWENLKILIGLNSNGVIKAIRNSTPLLQFFLLATTFKLCYTDGEVGNVFFNIIARSGVLNLHPVSASQLSRFVGAFSGHCDSILPVDLLHELAVLIDARSGNPAFYRRPDNNTIADIICKTFEALRDESIQCITLTGSYLGVWIATCFTWLLPEQTSISVEGQVVKGRGSSRLTIDLERDSGVSVDDIQMRWRMHTWRNEGQPTTFLFDSVSEHPTKPVEEFPRILSRSYYHQNHGLPILDPDGTKRQHAVQTIGELAGALVCYLTENGKVYIKKPCCGFQTDKPKCAQSSFMSIMDESWISCYAQIMKEYGWEGRNETLTGQVSAMKALSEQLGNNEITPKDLTQCCKDWVAKRAGIQGKTKSEYLPDKIVPVAMHLAVDAIAKSICDFKSGHQKVDPENVYVLKSNSEFVAALLSSDGLDLEMLRLKALNRVFPYTPSQSNDLAIAADGLVAGWSVLWEPTTEQKDVLRLRVARGGIRREGMRYEKIVQSEWSTPGRYDPGTPLNMFEGKTYIGLVPERERRKIYTQPIVSVTGNTLDFRCMLICRDEAGDEMSRTVSWISAMSYLAVAKHIDHGQLSTLQEEALAAILQRRHLEAYWISAFHEGSTMDRARKSLLRTAGNEELRFWAAAVLAESMFRKECMPLVVRHSGTILYSVNIAEKAKGYWTLIC
jgi:hypothetical protein